MTVPTIVPKATMEEAWVECDRLRAEAGRSRAEYDRLWSESNPPPAECGRLWEENNWLRAMSELVVIYTAQALYGKDVQIDWGSRTARGR